MSEQLRHRSRTVFTTYNGLKMQGLWGWKMYAQTGMISWVLLMAVVALTSASIMFILGWLFLAAEVYVPFVGMLLMVVLGVTGTNPKMRSDQNTLLDSEQVVMISRMAEGIYNESYLFQDTGEGIIGATMADTQNKYGDIASLTSNT